MRYGIALAFALSATIASADEPRVLNPTRISFAGPDPLVELEMASNETGVTFPGLISRRIPGSFSKRHVTFWEAVQALEEDRKGNIEIPTEGSAWKVAQRTAQTAPPVSLYGPFRLEIREVRAVGQFREANRRTDVVMQLAWEPRYPVCRADAQPRTSKLKDNLGNAYPPVEKPRRTSVRGNFAIITLPITDVPRAAADLAAIEGKIEVTACPAMKTVEFTNLGERTKFADTDSEVQLRAFQREGKYWSADIAVKYLARDMASFESFERERIGLHRATLISPTGIEYAPTGFEESDDRFAFRFEDDPKKPLKIGDLKGWKLKYRYPGAWVEVEVPFKFQKVPLP